MVGEDREKTLVIIILTSAYDKAMASFLLANSALDMGFKVHMYFAFLGVGVIKKGFKPKLPGMFRFLTRTYKKRSRSANVKDLENQIIQARKIGIRMYVCSMCIEAKFLQRDKIEEGVEIAGFATLMDLLAESDIQLVMG
jgi:predicted peroxiredoxin